MKFWVAGCLPLIVLLAAGCNRPENDPAAGPKDDPEAPTSSQNIRQLKELGIVDKVVGKGPAVGKGDLVFVTYTGKLKSGLEFDSNNKKDAQPYSFVLGAGAVISGWDEGLVGMKVGGTRQLAVPNRLAYGDQPQGEKVPAGADLYFEVRLDDAVKAGEEGVFDKTDVKPGTGRAAKEGDLVDVNYVMTLVNGKVVDRRMDPAAPVTFRLAAEKKVKTDRLVPAGLRMATLGMKEGGIRKMRIPPAVGFGTHVASGIPYNSIVLIELHLLKVRN